MIDEKRIRLLFSTAESMGLSPKLLTDSDYALVSIEINGKERYLFHKLSNPNSRMASALSKNKHTARIIFERNELPNITFCRPIDMTETIDFLSKHGKIIVKPLEGEKSQKIHLVSNEKELEKLDIHGCILEKFIKGQEIRYLVVNGEVKAVHHKVYKGEINNPDTVKRVSIEKERWDKQLIDIAIKAADAIGLNFCVVDFIVTKDGEAFILEINSRPGLERFQNPNEGPPVDIMRMYLEQIVKNYTTI